MASLRKRDEPPSTKPGHRVGAATATARTRSVPPVPREEDDRHRRSEAPTIPPPAPGGSKGSGIRPRRNKTKQPNAATVDEVVADLSRDPRREEDD